RAEEGLVHQAIDLFLCFNPLVGDGFAKALGKERLAVRPMVHALYEPSSIRTEGAPEGLKLLEGEVLELDSLSNIERRGRSVPNEIAGHRYADETEGQALID